ncbi:unknown [Prevotella sp. CAG:5226]|nr:unknown [Prevotella sp. CAG:5226]
MLAMALPRNRRKAIANIFYAPDATSNGGDASRVGFSAASLLNMFANALKIFVERLLVLVVNDVQQVFQLVADF